MAFLLLPSSTATAATTTTAASHRRSSLPLFNRRNVLLGLGGLYGAANLISTGSASADPVRPPQLDKCGPVTDAITGDKLEGVNCCLINGDITDYTLPPVTELRVRPSAHHMTAEYLFKYNLAVDRMKKLPDGDPRSFKNQANIHCAYCNSAYKQGGSDTVPLEIHNSWLFFPFHRWYLYFHERILGSLIDDPTFALPFWNWDNPKCMTIPPIFNDPATSLYDLLREPTHLPPALVDLGLTGSTDPLQLISNNLAIMYNEMIRANNTVYDFMGQPYVAGACASPGPGASERGSHTSVHISVGDTRQPRHENMGNFYSAARDPLFYCHHANVDRIWKIWSEIPSAVISDKRISHPDFLDATFLLYNEHGQLVRVAVRDAVDHLKMGFDYQHVDLPWLHYRPRRQINRAGGAKAPPARSLFPLNLEKIVRFEVEKTKNGKADESLVFEDIVVDKLKPIKFDVFINDEDGDDPAVVDKATYAGTYSQVPPKRGDTAAVSSITLRLTELYEDVDVTGDSVVVTLVPRHKGPGVTIGGVKIVANLPKTA